MKLMEVLKEVQILEKGDVGLKESIMDKYANAKTLVFKKLAAFKDELISKSQAKKLLTSDSDSKLNDIRSELIKAFVKKDFSQITALLNDPIKSKDFVDYLKLIEIAHGGRNNALKKAGDNKAFVNKVFDLVDGISTIKSSDDQ